MSEHEAELAWTRRSKEAEHVHLIAQARCRSCVEREAERDRAEDFRAWIVEQAFTAPDADWNTIRDSLTARLADGVAERDRLAEALREIADWDNSVEAEDCPTLRGIAREALTKTPRG